jgi:hypothetical protein
MVGKSSFVTASRLRLHEILLSHLQTAAGVGAWPGGDGLTIDHILDLYPEAVAAGQVPDWRELICQHPDLEAALHTWLAAKDRWQFVYR